MFEGMNWFPVSVRDPRAVDIFSRHYSSKKNGAGRQDWLDHGIKAPGEGIALMTCTADALFLWVNQIYTSNDQEGIYCACFRNEGPLLSSQLILEAEQIAWQRWPGERLYTYIDPAAIRSTNPGYTYMKAGWRRLAEKTSRGLRILEKRPKKETPNP